MEDFVIAISVLLIWLLPGLITALIRWYILSHKKDLIELIPIRLAEEDADFQEDLGREAYASGYYDLRLFLRKNTLSVNRIRKIFFQRSLALGPFAYLAFKRRTFKPHYIDASTGKTTFLDSD